MHEPPKSRLRERRRLSALIACLVAASALAAARGPARAQSADPAVDPMCVGAEGRDPCRAVYACLETKGAADAVLAFGRMRGLRRGQAELKLSTGARCVGRWSGEGAGGAVHLRCDDRRRFAIYFQSEHAETETIVGRGTSNQGEDVVGWAGPRAQAYLSEVGGAPFGSLPCASGAVALPTS